LARATGNCDLSRVARGSMAPALDAPEIKIKVSWLKQKLAEGRRQPVLDFDEQQIFHFDPHRTTFKMVKHSCSYPAPPHKVRMWCSSFGAANDLPLSMELNVFINTFELITEEKHSLAMVSRRQRAQQPHPHGLGCGADRLPRPSPSSPSPVPRPRTGAPHRRRDDCI